MRNTVYTLLSRCSLLATVAALFATACASAPHASVPTPPSVSEAILAAPQGGVAILEGYSLREFPAIAYEKKVAPGPKLIISDDPEYIRQPEGIALQEPLEPGAYRLYVYNVNGMKDPAMDRKISVVIENLGAEPMHLRFDRYSYRAPSGNYFGVAKNALYDYHSYLTPDEGALTLTVAPGDAVPLDPKMEAAVAKPDELVHTLHEFTVDQPGRLSVVQTAPDVPSPTVLERMDSVIASPRKNAGRGTFATSNYTIRPVAGTVIDSADGPVQLIVADGDTDPWVRGTDGSTGAELELKGNYGVMYDIELEWTSSDGRGLALLTWNARFGSAWCNGMANCVVVGEGLHPAGVVKLPSDRLLTKSEPEALVIQVFTPPADGERGTLRLTYSPPGASCLPTPLVLVPVDLAPPTGSTD